MDSSRISLMAHPQLPKTGVDIYLALRPAKYFFNDHEGCDNCDGCDGRILFGREGCDNCDGGGCDGFFDDSDCSSAQLTTTAYNRASFTLDKPLRTLPSLRYANYSPGYDVIYSPRAASQIAVITPGAHAILDFFHSPNKLQNWPVSATISLEDAAKASKLLYQGGFLVDETDTLKLTEQTRKPKALEAWLYLTRDCNLRCAHCYVKKDPRNMDTSTGRKAILKLFHMAQQNGFRVVKIKYAGGEPTLRWELVQNLHQYTHSLAAKTGLGLREILVTNGVNLPHSRLEYLKQTGIKLSISLDGFENGQNRQRPMVKGNSSFARVIKNIELALHLGIYPALTITLTSLNLNDLPRVVQFALQNNLHININFYRPIAHGDPLMPKSSELVQALWSAIHLIHTNLPSYRIIDTLIDRSNFRVSHQHTCGAGRNYLSIDTDGSVLPCHMLHGANDLRFVTSLDDACFSFPSFENPSVEERQSCRECSWKFWCTGGCPILAGNLRSTANSNSPYCAVYKAIYPELIKLEGARLLKYGMHMPVQCLTNI